MVFDVCHINRHLLLSAISDVIHVKAYVVLVNLAADSHIPSQFQVCGGTVLSFVHLPNHPPCDSVAVNKRSPSFILKFSCIRT